RSVLDKTVGILYGYTSRYTGILSQRVRIRRIIRFPMTIQNLFPKVQSHSLVKISGFANVKQIIALASLEKEREIKPFIAEIRVNSISEVGIGVAGNFLVCHRKCAIVVAVYILEV